MKKQFQTAIKCFFAVIVASTISGRSISQDIIKTCNFTSSELTAKYTSYSADADFKLLLAGLKEKGWVKLTNEGSSFGFSGTLRDSITKTTLPVEFCAFDFYNKATNQAGSIIWRNDGKATYKAYLTFAPGEKDINKALEGSVEMFAEGGKVLKASSWGRCFKNCANSKCPNFCFGAIIFCASGLAVPGGGGVAAWIGCAGIACGLCFAVCALNCR